VRKLLVTLDDDLDKVLAGLPNQSGVVRAALRLYMCDISTDTLEGLRAAFHRLEQGQHQATKRFNEQYEMIEKLYNIIMEFANR
jgi:hypothetical protein